MDRYILYFDDCNDFGECAGCLTMANLLLVGWQDRIESYKVMLEQVVNMSIAIGTLGRE